MRICFVVRYFPLPTETFILSQIAYFVREGHDVVVLSNGKAEDAEGDVVHEEVEQLGLMDRVQPLMRLPIGNQARAANAIRQMVRLSMTSPLRLNEALRFDESVRRMTRFRLLAALANAPGGLGRFDGIIAHFGPAAEIASYLRKLKVIDGPLLSVFHGFDMTREFRERPNAYTGLLQRTRPSDRFLPISDNWRRVLLDRGFSPEQTTVHRMGVDPTRFEPIEQPAHEGPLRVVSVCRLVEKKGIGFLIKAVALANREQPGTCVLDLYGDGPMRRELEAIASGEAVRFHGAVSQQAVVDALADADVLAAPSVTSEAGDQEGIPVAIMEAMARGLPVLTTRHSGIPELVEHDVSGLLADERDVAGLAANLQKLAASPDLRRRMGEAGRQKVIEQYDQRKLNDRLAQMIASISS